MSVRKNPFDRGPDLLARFLGEYQQSRQMSDMERTWGFGDDSLDTLWTRLIGAIHTPDARRLNAIVDDELSDAERERIIESLAPVIFAFPLRNYPADLRAFKEGEHLVFVLSNTDEVHSVGHLPASLGPAFAAYLRRVMHLTGKQRRKETVISSMGRRRAVIVTILQDNSGASIHFIGRLPSHGEEP